MPSNAPTRVAVVIALALAVVTSGCGLLPADQAEGSEPVGTDAAERYAAVDGLSATMVVETTRGNETTRIRANLKMRPGEGLIRQEVVAPPDRAGDVFVSNGSVFWSYNATENVVRRTEIDSRREDRQYGEFLQRVFDEINENRSDAAGTETPTVGVSALPVVPRGDEGGATAISPNGSLEDYNVTYRGTATVDGRTTHVVHLSPRPSHESIGGNQTLWIDTTHYVPLKIHQSTTVNDKRIESTVVYRNVSFNPGLTNETFTFDPPADASVETSRFSSESYDSLAAAGDAVNFSAPEPDPPKGFELNDTRVTRTRNVSALTATYTNGSHDIVVTKQSGTPENVRTPDGGENVTVDGVQGTYHEFGRTGVVTWRCGGFVHAVTGDLSKESLIAVARSVGCA